MAIRSIIIAALAWLGAGLAAAQAAPEAQASPASAKAEKNKKDGEAFLAVNKAREGVVTLKSGLQYEILKAGEGRKPALADTVVVHYKGTLLDGTEFGNSYRSRRPGTLPLRAAIGGWREALPLMAAGSRWRLFVPPHLAYGERGAGSVIGPNATLVFEAELISVVTPEASRTTQAALTGIEVSYKLDPRLTKGLYLGDRWVSRASFTPSSKGKTASVEASARGIDARGGRVEIEPEWIAADPGMVEITKSAGRAVKITVKRPGETRLQVAYRGITKALAVKATERGGGLAVEISE